MNSHVLSLRARRAATVIDDEALDRLDELNQRMGEAIKSEATSDLSSINRQYHREINLAAQPPRLLAFVRLAEISIPDLTFEPHPAHHPVPSTTRRQETEDDSGQHPVEAFAS